MRWWVALLLMTPLLAGCLSGDDDRGRPVSPPELGYDPGSVTVTGYRKEAVTVTSFDGTALATVAYVPLTSDALPDGSSPKFPVVVFLHGWGFFKEQFEGTQALHEEADPDRSEVPEEVSGQLPAEFTNVLAHFAANGFVAVAYDARGFGRSTGITTMGGPAEMADLDAVLDYVEALYPAADRVGVVGTSYGGGQALMAWAHNDRVDTAVPMYGWYDLYDGLLPGNVPKIAWAEALFALGAAGSGGQTHNMMLDWYQQLYTRADLRGVAAEMDVRSAAGDLASVSKPLFVCHGLQESLFPQGDAMWQEAGGFTRAYIYTGGHNVMDPGCLERALAWLHFFLGGFETGVDAWPALETQDAADTRFVGYDAFPSTAADAWFLRAPDLTRSAYSNVTFTVSQQVLANPFHDPAVLSDAVGPAQALPVQFRQDPTVVSFSTPAFREGAVLVGAPVLTLQMVDTEQVDWQVVGTLLLEHEGRSRILSHAAFSPRDVDDLQNGTVELRFHYTKADIASGDRVTLTLGANDPSWWMPLFANYDVTFDGRSRLVLPLFG